MKFTAIVLGLAISSAAFSATILNGVKLSGLPTASKFYSKSLSGTSEISNVSADLQASCKADRAAAEALLVKSGSKILASEGCVMNVNSNNYCDQGGCDDSTTVDTKFEITFK